MQYSHSGFLNVLRKIPNQVSTWRIISFLFLWFLQLSRHKKPCSWSYKWESDLLSTMWLWYLGSSSVISALQRLWILCSFYLPGKYHARLRCTENSNSAWFYNGNMPRKVPAEVRIISSLTMTVHYHSIKANKSIYLITKNNYLYVTASNTDALSAINSCGLQHPVILV